MKSKQLETAELEKRRTYYVRLGKALKMYPTAKDKCGRYLYICYLVWGEGRGLY